MAEQDPVLMSEVLYYCQERLNYCMRQAVTEGLSRFSNDAVLKFFLALVDLLDENIQDAISSLENLKDRRDVNVAALLALVYAHKKARVVDKEAVQRYEGKIKELRKQAGELGLYTCGIFLISTHRHEKAREYMDRMLKMNERSHLGLTARGWIEMATPKASRQKHSPLIYFDQALQAHPSHLDAMIGKARCLAEVGDLRRAVDAVNQAVVCKSDFLPALLEKTNLSLASYDWDQVYENAQRCLDVDSECYNAIRYVVLCYLCRDGNSRDATVEMSKLMKLLERYERRNPKIFVESAALFSRVSDGDGDVVKLSYEMAERALQIASDLSPGQTHSLSAVILNELGTQLLIKGQVRDALKCFHNSLQQDQTNFDAITGKVECQIEVGELDEAAQQLEFLKEFEQNLQNPARVAYLTARLNQARHTSGVVENFERAVGLHFESIQNVRIGFQYMIMLNADFLIKLAEEMLKLGPQQPVERGQPVPSVLAECVRVLERVSRMVPGQVSALFLLAKVRFLMGDNDSALNALRISLEKNPTRPDAHVLMAQIALERGDFAGANQSLEVALSYNFEVREHPLYHLIKSRIAKRTGDTDESIRLLQKALQLPGVRSASSASSRGQREISLRDRVSVFLELAAAYLENGRQHEATQVMQDALNEFQDTPEAARVSIANAELSVGRDDLDDALATLRAIGPKQPYFVEARQKMAEIYMKHRKDKRLYVACYREMAEKCPGPKTSLMLADAYMDVQEPDKAIEVYESLLKRNPRDSNVASKIGKALIRTHNYVKAVSYYESALKVAGQALLRHDLVTLLLRLKYFDKAERAIRQGLDRGTHESDEKFGTPSGCRIAVHHEQVRQFDDAIGAFKESLSYYESSTVMLELARIYVQTGQLEDCEQLCQQIVKENKGDVTRAVVLMADVVFRSGDYNSAMEHFSKLLERQPDNYEALARYADLLRRTGRLSDEFPTLLDAVLRYRPQADMDAGYNYCVGLLEWYHGNSTAALDCFNKARLDAKFGFDASCNMVEICLNPEQNTLGGEVFDDAPTEAEREQAALKTAEKILRDMKSSGTGDLRAQLLPNLWLISTRQKVNIDKAINSLTHLIAQQGETISIVYLLAVSYMIMKQSPKTKAYLKKIVKSAWTLQDADYLEKSWLLLADIYVSAQKYDMATELLKLCLQYNRSCWKAYEYVGFIMEKEQNYREAAKSYDQAWRYSNKHNPNIGYKLAYNLLKTKRYTDAIEICHCVLKQFPQYPKIRKEILEKARVNLRT